MMNDMGRRMPEKSTCYTPHDLQDKFSRACEKIPQIGDRSICDQAWEELTGGFKFNTVRAEDYDQYFLALCQLQAHQIRPCFGQGCQVWLKRFLSAKISHLPSMKNPQR